MTHNKRMSPGELGAALTEFLEQVVAPTPEPTEVSFGCRLREHLDTDPTRLDVLAEHFDTAEHPNLQIAIEAYLEGVGRSAELIGVIGRYGRGDSVSMSDILASASSRRSWDDGPTASPVEYVNFPLGDDRVLKCLQSCLLLLRDGASRLAVLLSAPVDGSPREQLAVEVLCRESDTAERFLAELRATMRDRNVYRGQVLGLRTNRCGTWQLQVHKLPHVERDQVVLPPGALERIERQTLSFVRHRQRLLAAGRHLKRGILLHGPPGTGKTLTVMYLAGQMRDRTTVLLTGAALGWLEWACALARSLQPSMMVLEDVDLVAAERTRPGARGHPLLFELLNQMDGLAEDADVIFVLTTNRPDAIEPALASRPGRIDQAIEVPLPDVAGRRRLIELYGRGLTLQLDDLDHFVDRTKGASAAFIRELLRRSALLAAEEGDEVAVADRHLTAALDELLVAGGELTKHLLGMGARSVEGWHHELLHGRSARRAVRAHDAAEPATPGLDGAASGADHSSSAPRVV